MTIHIHLDAVKAYMNSDIDTDIWVYPPHDPDEVFFKKGNRIQTEESSLRTKTIRATLAPTSGRYAEEIRVQEPEFDKLISRRGSLLKGLLIKYRSN